MSHNKAQQTQSTTTPCYKQIISQPQVLTQPHNSETNKVRDETKKRIPITCLIGQCSCTFVIKKDFCTDYGLDSNALVIAEQRQDGLLIRKVVI